MRCSWWRCRRSYTDGVESGEAMALVSAGYCCLSSSASAFGHQITKHSSSFASRKRLWSDARLCGPVHASRRLLNLIIASSNHQHKSSHPVHLLPQSRSQFAFTDTRHVLPIRALLALSAAAAVAFLQRKQGVQLARSRTLMIDKEEEFVPNVMMAKQEEIATTTRKIDIHLHVWASATEANEFPYFPGQEPTLQGDVHHLLENMEEAGVDGALIIQPINHKFDHSYVSSVIKKYPGKFVGCCLADPSDGGGGVSELERLISEEGYRAVRFNPSLWPAGEKMTNQVGKAMFVRAGELGAVVGFMCFKGLLLYIDDIEQLCVEFPGTKVMIDHLGFCKPVQCEEEGEAWERLLSLARFSQVYVKASAFFRISRETFPYRDTWPLLQQLVDSFGAEKVLWGSDFPFVAAECGYAKACQELPSVMSSELSLSTEEWEWILGRTAFQHFSGAWQESVLVS